MVRDYRNIDDYILSSRLGIEKKVGGFVIYSYQDVSEYALLTQNSFRHHYFELSLEINNGCSFQIDDFKFPLGEKRLTIIAPNRLQTNIAHSNLIEESKGFTIFFKPDFLGIDFSQKRNFPELSFLSPNKSPAFQLKDKQLKEITDIFQLIQYEQNEYGESGIGIIKNLTKVLFEKAKNYQSITSPNTVYTSLVSEFLVLCNNHFLGLHTVKEFAQKLHVTPKHLTETVKKETGITALQTIHRAKVTYAKGLLKQTNLSVKEIAYDLGFENPEYFNVFFKRITGQTPRQFRQF